jgi:hypothetical protein
MTVWETLLVFVGIPAGVFALVGGLVLAPSATRAPRYRPNGGWHYQPVWYLPHPVALGDKAAGHAVPALPGGSAEVTPVPVVANGGASGEW